jgi:hypothetical protein
MIRMQGVYATAEERDAARHPAFAQFDRLVGRAALRSLQRYGHEPLDREVTAAHEAGHVIVALAIGHATRVDRIIVKRAPRYETRFLPGDAWLGRCYLSETVAVELREAAGAGKAWPVVREATFVLAGMAGETAIGRAHPSSSIEDRTRAQLTCQVAAALELGAPPPTLDESDTFDDWCEAHKDAVVDLTRTIFVACGSAAMQAIERNRRPFDRLRHKLMTHERLGWPEVEPLVEDLQLTPLGVAQ